MSRRVLSIALVGLVLVAAGCGSNSSAEQTTTQAAAQQQQAEGPPPPTQTFKSRPDLKPPPLKVLTAAHGTAPGYVFIGPKMKVVQAGPMIVDNRGQVVWFKPLLDTKGISDVKVQHYHGKPVITWWRGRAPMGVGSGYYVLYDDRYKEVARVRAGHGFDGDIHEFLITPRNTAVFTVYHRVPADLSSVGGPKQGKVFDGIVQEVDIPTGKVLWEWHSWPTVGVKASYFKPVPSAKKGAKAPPYDYIHLNSVAVEANGNFLVSARNTHAIYEIDRKTKKILWQIGGKSSSFKMGKGTNFEWQHNARRQPDGTITLFDNGAAPPLEKFTRILVLKVDPKAKKVTLVRSYHHPQKLLAPFEGNAQFLPNGDVFVGWGAIPRFSEFSHSGKLLFDVSFGKGTAKVTKPDQDADSYRAFRYVWHGHPSGRPATAVSGGKLYASWNGATEVTKWQLMTGKSGTGLKPGATVATTGFETAVPLNGATGFVAVRALNASGDILGTSRPVRAGG